MDTFFEGLGLLKAIEIVDPNSGRTALLRPAKSWLGYDRKKKAFLICRAKRKTTRRPPPAIERAHRRFHGAASNGSLIVTNPTLKSANKPRILGLLKALVYDVPNSVKSPTKNRSHWHHLFGDTGHSGKNKYSYKVMPLLIRDKKGNLFIKRRKGNIFTVDTWLRG